MIGTSSSTHTGRILRIAAVTMASLISALAAWVYSAGSALAPEPATLSASLAGTQGSSAAGTYLYSTAPTRVLFYSSSWTAHSTGPAAGTPCSTVSLAKGAVTAQVIQAQGNYRRCI